MSSILLLSFLAVFQAVQSVELSVESLKKRDLPNDFPFQIFEAGFAVIRVSVVNTSGEVLTLDADDLLIHGPGGKRLTRAQPEDITPRLMKYYKGSIAAPAGDVYGRTVPMPMPRGQTSTIEPRARGGAVSIDVPVRLRNILFHYQLQAAELGPGEKSEGLVYLKSKKSGTHLTGGSVIFEGSRAAIH